jgi:general nucleoside transport system ATP-binding protein
MAYLEALRIVKRYGRVTANDGAFLRAEEGKILAVLGENGAGKTTLMRIISGEIPADSGEILIGGKAGGIAGPGARRSRPPVALAHQHPLLVEELSVAENVFLGREPVHLGIFTRGRAMRERAASLVREFGLDIDPDARAGRLSFADRQRTEILRALSHGARILALDEPTSHLSEGEASSLFASLEKFRASGMGIILVTHRLDEALSRADSFMVLRAGRTVLETGEADEERLVQAMFGKYAALLEKEPDAGIDAASKPSMFKAEGLVTGKRGKKRGLGGIDMDIRSGRILCVLSIAGNGERDLEDAVAGMLKPSFGSLKLLGKDVTRAAPRERRRIGMAYVPRERMKRGICPNASIADNLLIHDTAFYVFPGRSSAVKHAEAAERLEAMEINANPGEKAVVLSGGQAQRLIVGRELGEKSPFILLSEPTWGMDARSAAECHDRIKKEAAAGKSILVILSQIKEALVLGHEIAVLYRGRIVLKVENDASPGIEGRLRAAMTGGAP